MYETAQGLQAVEPKSGATFASDWPDAYVRQGCQVLGWRELSKPATSV